MTDLKPMLAKVAEPGQLDEFLNDDRWIITPKADGHRRLISTDGAGNLTILNRAGTPTTLPRPIHKALAALTMPITFDGELIANETLVIFDMPEAGGKVGPWYPLSDRLTILEALFARWDPPSCIRLLPRATTPDEKAAMVEWVAAGKGEGIVAKLADGTYESGARSRGWRKVKRHHAIDCEVMELGVVKANMIVGVYRDGVLTEVGECGRLSGDGKRVKKGDVVEIRVLSVSDDNRLVQPTLPMLRGDKRPEECTWAQLDPARTDKTLILNWKA